MKLLLAFRDKKSTEYKEDAMAFKIESSLLDACALAILSRGDTYGYEITQSMKQAIVVSESTLYPVLRRLQKGNYCQTYDEPYQGRNRRYYSITEEGKAKLEEYKLQWIDYKTAIETFLGDGGDPAGQSGPGGSDAGNGTAGQSDAGDANAGGSGSGDADAGNTSDADQNKVGGEEHE